MKSSQYKMFSFQRSHDRFSAISKTCLSLFPSSAELCIENIPPIAIVLVKMTTAMFYNILRGKFGESKKWICGACWIGCLMSTIHRVTNINSLVSFSPTMAYCRFGIRSMRQSCTSFSCCKCKWNFAVFTMMSKCWPNRWMSAIYTRKINFRPHFERSSNVGTCLLQQNVTISKEDIVLRLGYIYFLS